MQVIQMVRVKPIVTLISIASLSFLSVRTVESNDQQNSTFQESSLLPKAETGATRFLKKYSAYDGRGTIVAIFDTGVDPGAVGLAVTTEGKPKVIDIIDATGEGDVTMSQSNQAKDGMISGLSGRTLKVNKKWKNPSGNYCLGLKAAYDFFPDGLIQRMKIERTKTWKIQQRQREAQLITDLSANNSKIDKKERQARLDALRSAIKQYNDPGPIYDCVTFHDGKTWRAVIDTDEDGDLTDEQTLTDYRDERQFATFDDQSRLNFSVNIYDQGKLLSLVAVSGEHGTHVAGIVAANFPDLPQRNGLAPGAQIVSVKIGDGRLGGMETGTALIRGLKRVAEMNCDLINMSFGEAAATPNQGRLIDEFNKIVREKKVIFVASAGNSGPALSTAGAPGGTSSEVIGVGAYVSPEMGKVEYALRKELPGLPYTWTSRGPTTDGDWGVDLFAPGGAVAPVPTYSLQPNRRMNGTSMASPNACGNIALMLSGLKQQNQKFSPSSVLRSLQATALRIDSVDRLAQGPGLVQIDQAFEHHLHRESQAELIDVQVSIPSRNNARGFYLRDAFEQSNPTEATVQVHPEFSEVQDNDLKLSYDIPVILEATADWVDAGSHLQITHGGGSFEVMVDATKLKPGLHTAEIIGREAGALDRGALFRVPVVVTVPEKLIRNRFQKKLPTNAGSLTRTFLTPPEGSRFADLKVKRNGGTGSSFLYVHCIQLVPGESFEEHETMLKVGFQPNEEYTKRISVMSGRTLEVCLAQYWSSLGDGQLELDVSFGGLAATEETLTLLADGTAEPLPVVAHLDYTKSDLSGSLNRWHRHLQPSQSATQLLLSERDVLWNQQHIWQLVIDYEFEMHSSSIVKLSTPPLAGLIYDLPVDSYRLFLFDQNQLHVASDDMYPSDISLKPGKYTAQVEYRHTDPEKLKQYEKQPLVLEQSINRIGMNFYGSREAAHASGRTISSLELAQGERTTLWTRVPVTQSLPKHASNGDVLLGSISLVKDDPAPIQVRYVVSTAEQVKQAAANQKQVTELAKAEVEFLLSTLKTLNWSKHQELIKQITEKIESIDPKNRQLRIERLHLADSEERKERLEEVVKLANLVIKSIKVRKLKQFTGISKASTTPEEKQLQQEIDAMKTDLIDALYRKGRALAYMELPDVVAKHPIQDQKGLDERFEKNFQQLNRWVDTTAKDYYLLHIRRDRRNGNYAQAIQLLNKHTGKDQPVSLHYKKRRDLYELLDWNDWQTYEQNWMLRYFPKERVLF